MRFDYILIPAAVAIAILVVAAVYAPRCVTPSAQPATIGVTIDP